VSNDYNNVIYFAVAWSRCREPTARSRAFFLSQTMAPALGSGSGTGTQSFLCISRLASSPKLLLKLAKIY